MESFETLVRKAEEAHFSGWDFSWLEGKLIETPPPWEYHQLVESFLPMATSLLDMATGGGEFLSNLTGLPKQTFATENYQPNIALAEVLLNPMGIEVRQLGENYAMPFEDNFFDLIINRHGSFDVTELYRVLKPGGYFLTQKVGAFNNIELNEFLAPEVMPTYSVEKFQFDVILENFCSAGFNVLRSESAGTPAIFLDISAVIYYLKVIKWQIEGFSVEKYDQRLRELDVLIRKVGSFACTSERYLFVLQKPFN